MLSLEAVLVLPVLALMLVTLLQGAVVIRDVLLLHEAARAGARVAATSSGPLPVQRAARAAAPELALRVEVRPVVRRAGDEVVVTVETDHRVGPVTHRLRARAVQVVEPVIGGVPSISLPSPPTQGSDRGAG